MSLSMDEQRMLAEIERRLSAEDPRLAARLSSFRRPGPAATLRSPRGRIIGSLFTVALVAVISMMVYAMVPFRAHGVKSTMTPQASTSAPVRSRAPSSAANTSASASTDTTKSAAATKTVKTSTADKTSATGSAAKTTAAKTASRTDASGKTSSTPPHATRAPVPSTSG
jgi:cytoskeletal protein RodZ